MQGYPVKAFTRRFPVIAALALTRSSRSLVHSGWSYMPKQIMADAKATSTFEGSFAITLLRFSQLER
jgi:hypothetical protein